MCVYCATQSLPAYLVMGTETNVFKLVRKGVSTLSITVITQSNVSISMLQYAHYSLNYKILLIKCEETLRKCEKIQDIFAKMIGFYP